MINNHIWLQTEITLSKAQRGFHIITKDIDDSLRSLDPISVGILNIFIKHTSASIAINEGADPSVRIDFETHFNKLVPENSPDFIHSAEGPDDMPAHIKSALLGSTLSVPIKDGRMNLGTWQDIYLCEHRNHAPKRTLVLTLNGQKIQN